MATTERATLDGTAYFDGSSVTYRGTSGHVLSTPNSELAIIGEFTTAGGPGADWYFVLVLRGSSQWAQFPMYAEGIETLCDKLSEFWGSRVQVGLANRTDLTSRIMWPPELVDRPLFTFTPFRKGNILRRLISSIVQETSGCLSSEILSAAGVDA